MLKFYQTERGKESKRQASERQKGDKNTCHKISKETRQRINKIVSEKIKIRILNGQFTPKVTNSWANSRVKIKINGYDKEYRSSWDAAFQILNPTFVYEKIRIPYINERNEEHVYIVDFVDETNKILYEIKPSRCVDNIRNILKTKYAIEWCEKNGYKYKIISDEYFKTNVKIINFSDYDSRIYNGMKQFL